MAVTLSRMPSALSRRMSAYAGSRRVLVTGTFTYTFGPQVAISRAWRSISSNSSENTSNEMGRSGIAATTSCANAR